MLGLGIERKALTALDKHVFLKKDFKPEEAVTIFGSHRSGTTWLMETLSRVPGYISVMEPFQPKWFPGSARYQPRPNPKQPKITEYIKKTLEGKAKCTASKYKLNFKTLRRRYTGDKLLIKFVRANTLIELVLKEFKVRTPVYIIRNPYAVISSQLRTGIHPELTLLYKKQSTDIETTLTKVWYVDQKAPLNMNDSRLYKIKYEDMVTDPIKTMTPLLKRLRKEEHIHDILETIQRPSRTTARPKVKDIDDKILNRWKNELNKTQIKNITDTLEHFNFDYNEIQFQYQ
ncbi:MAG: sulfotransferase [Candidatus Bathyarchaeota archaeon]